MKNIYQLIICDYVILGSMRNVKNVMKCLCAVYVDSRKKQRLLSMSSALLISHDVMVVFHYSVVPASELELKAHVHIKIMYSNLVETTSL